MNNQFNQDRGMRLKTIHLHLGLLEAVELFTEEYIDALLDYENEQGEIDLEMIKSWTHGTRPSIQEAKCYLKVLTQRSTRVLDTNAPTDELLNHITAWWIDGEGLTPKVIDGSWIIEDKNKHLTSNNYIKEPESINSKYKHQKFKRHFVKILVNLQKLLRHK